MAADLRRISGSIGDLSRKLEPSTRRSWKRLSGDQRADVVARYDAGETSTVLASEYGVAKSTILGILRANSVVVRRQPLTAEQVGEAVQLYETGLSLSEAADRLRVNQETMRVAMLAAGVSLRAPTGKAPIN